MAGNVKRQDIGRGLLQFATSNPDAHSVTWQWFRDNIEKLNKMLRRERRALSIHARLLSIIVSAGWRSKKLFSEH